MKDRRSGIEKTFAGDIGSLNTRDGVGAARLVTSFAPIPGMQVLDPALAGAQGMFSADDEREDLQNVCGSDLRAASRKSRLIRRKLAELDNRPASAMAEAGTTSVGALVGGAAGSFVPVPILGTVGGAWIGSSIAQTLYDDAMVTQDQDAISMVAQIRSAQQQGQRVPPEVVFATLAASIPGPTGKKIENRLQALTGTRQFSEAVAQGKNRQLQQMMREYDLDIRAYTQMPVDRSNPHKSASRQYAELINTRRMDARALLLDPVRMPKVSVQQSQKPMRPARQPIAQMDLRAIAANLTKLGVTPTIGDDGQPQLVPLGKSGRTRV